MRLAASPVPVSSSSGSPMTPPIQLVLPTWVMPPGETIGRPADLRGPSGYWPGEPGRPVRDVGRGVGRAVPGRTTMRVEELSGDDAAVYRAVAEAEAAAGAPH